MVGLGRDVGEAFYMYIPATLSACASDVTMLTLL